MKNNLLKSVFCVSLSLIAAASVLTGCTQTGGNEDNSATTTEYYQVTDTDYSFDKKYYTKLIPPKEEGGDPIIGICLTETDEISTRIMPTDRNFKKVVWDDREYKFVVYDSSDKALEAYALNDKDRWEKCRN